MKKQNPYRKNPIRVRFVCFLVDFDLDLHVAAVCGGAHNGADCLCNATLLADDSAHVVFSNVKMENNNAFFVDLVFGHGDCIWRFNKTLGDGGEQFFHAVSVLPVRLSR